MTTAFFLGRDVEDQAFPWLEEHMQMYVVQESRKLSYYLAADFNAGKRNHMKAKALGLLPGVPDVRYYCSNGLIVWIEYKRTKDGKLSPDQKAHHAILKMHGYHVFTVFASTPADAWRQTRAILQNYSVLIVAKTQPDKPPSVRRRKTRR